VEGDHVARRAPASSRAPHHQSPGLAAEGLSAESLDVNSVTPLSPPTDLRATERRMIEQVLRETDGNKSKAARRLGFTRTQLYVRLRKRALAGHTG
jgi:DNA-binding NtrC family response regulator